MYFNYLYFNYYSTTRCYLLVAVLNRVENYVSSVTSYHGGSAADMPMKTQRIIYIWCVLTTQHSRQIFSF